MTKKQQLVQDILLDMKNYPDQWEDYLLQIAEEYLNTKTLQYLKETLYNYTLDNEL